mmetsp:Transcript_18505/g.31667  ORF Transcript_18505/g.31667 Transcript_18505/m.31667 type:complete len:445 (+) Transcript_18505:4184-5518(+)
MTLGRPQPVKLGARESTYLEFVFTGRSQIQLELEILLGQPRVYLIRSSDQEKVREYPLALDPQLHLVNSNTVQFNLSAALDYDHSSSSERLRPGKYGLKIVSGSSEEFEGIAYLKDLDDIDLIADDHPKQISSVFQQAARVESAPSFFLYLPPAHNFDLEVNAQLKSFQTDTGSSFTASEGGASTVPDWVDFFDFKVSLKVIKLEEDIKTANLLWQEVYTQDEQFDFIFHTNETQSSGVRLFNILKLSLDPAEDVILVKVDQHFLPQHMGGVDNAELVMELLLSSSEVSPIAPGQTLKGTVSDEPDKFRIYELFVNRMQFEGYVGANESRNVDLFITLRPCTGNLDFFITDDFSQLFKQQSLLKQTLGQSTMKLQGSQQYRSDPSNEIQVVHKVSKLSEVGKAYPDSFGLDEYIDSFRIKGKRLKHVDKLNGKKLYIGVRASAA